MRRRTGLIISLDIPDGKKAIDIAEEISDLVDGIKAGYPLVLSEGVKILRELSNFAPVISDFKVADIPVISSSICRIAFSSGASGVIIHGFLGERMIEECCRVAREEKGEIYVVSEMTHEGSFFERFSWEIVSIAKKCGAEGIIVPGNKPERISELKRMAGKLKILCPGIGVQGGSARRAIDSGADWIIVGRSIYTADKPRERTLSILKEMGI